MASKDSKNVQQLFKSAKEQGLLSKESMQALNVVDIGAQIQAGLGINVDDVQASEVVLVTMMIDDSGSIRFMENTQVVRDGHNLVIDSLLECKQKDSILIHTRYLNGSVLFPYTTLNQAIKMDTHNYNPNLGTPLYDQAVVLLGTVLAKTQEFADNGVPVRSVTLIITDGADEHSRKSSPGDVASIVEDMLRTENHIIAAMGINDGHTNFSNVFKEMGLKDEWILTPENTKSEIRKAFVVFSQSAVRASKSAKSFSQTAMSGFGN